MNKAIERRNQFSIMNKLKLKTTFSNPLGMFRRHTKEERPATCDAHPFNADLYAEIQRLAETDLLVSEVAYRQLEDELWMCQIAKQRMANPFTRIKSKQVHIKEFNAESTYGLTFLWNKKFLSYKIKMLKSQVKLMKQDKIRADDFLTHIRETIQLHTPAQRLTKKQMFWDLMRFEQQDDDLRSAYCEIDRNVKVFEAEQLRLRLGGKDLIGVEIPPELRSSKEKIGWLDLKIQVSKKAMKYILTARRGVAEREELYMNTHGIKYSNPFEE